MVNLPTVINFINHADKWPMLYNGKACAKDTKKENPQKGCMSNWLFPVNQFWDIWLFG